MFVLVVTALTSSIVSLQSWRRRDRAWARPLSFAGIAVTIMAAGYAVELANPQLENMLLAVRFQYIGIVSIPVFWLWFALTYTGRSTMVDTSRHYALLIVPALTLMLAWTNDLHGLIWQSTAVTVNENGTFFAPTYGSWFWMHTLYSYSLILLATGFLMMTALRTHRLFRWQALMLVMAAVAPLLGNLLYLLRIGPGQFLDLLPIGFGISVLLVALLTMRGRLLEAIPLARTLTFEQMRDGVVVLDPERRIVDLNITASKMFNRAIADVIGMPITALFPADVNLPVQYLTAHEIDEEIALTTSTGLRWFSIQVFPLAGWRGRIKGWLVHWRDITSRRQDEELLRLRNAELEALHLSLQQELVERQRTEIALAQARDMAEASSRTKSAFIGNMSHELRTPLTSIIGYAQLIERQLGGGDDELIRSELDIIINAGRHQVELINDLLDLAKIEAGQMQFKYGEFAIGLLIDRTIQMVQPLTQRGGNRLVIDVSDEVEIYYGDEQKIGQILINLLSNAAKFTQQGTITLRVRYDLRNDGAWIEFSVHDTGIGIAPAFLTTIFEEFSQIPGSLQQQYGGTGLGLTICKRYTELMKGTISVTSEENRGSSFYVRLPVERDCAIIAPPSIALEVSGKRKYVVDTGEVYASPPSR